MLLSYSFLTTLLKHKYISHLALNTNKQTYVKYTLKKGNNGIDEASVHPMSQVNGTRRLHNSTLQNRTRRLRKNFSTFQPNDCMAKL